MFFVISQLFHLKVLGSDLVVEGEYVLVVEGHLPEDQAVQGDPQRPDVCCLYNTER